MKRILLCIFLALMLLLSACAAPSDNTDDPFDKNSFVEAPDPLDMIGTWDRAWSEVEGDRTEYPKGTCTVVIKGDSKESLVISYADKEFPDNNYENKSLTIKKGVLYYDCGNDLWHAEVDRSASTITEYNITLLEDGTLLLQNLFYIDGAPMVSYECFVRAE